LLSGFFSHRQFVITSKEMGDIKQMTKKLDDGCVTKTQEAESNGKEKY